MYLYIIVPITTRIVNFRLTFSDKRQHFLYCPKRETCWKWGSKRVMVFQMEVNLADSAVVSLWHSLDMADGVQLKESSAAVHWGLYVSDLLGESSDG